MSISPISSLGHLVGHHRVEYVDANQNPIGEVRFDEAVEIKP